MIELRHNLWMVAAFLWKPEEIAVWSAGIGEMLKVGSKSSEREREKKGSGDDYQTHPAIMLESIWLLKKIHIKFWFWLANCDIMHLIKTVIFYG